MPAGFATGQVQPLLQGLTSCPAGATVMGVAMALLGLKVLRALVGASSMMYAYFLRGPKRELRYYGKWAAVTGATDGIGRAYAAELAKKGLNLVLISRTESKLKECAQKMQAWYGVQTRICAADLCDARPDVFAKIAAALDGLEVGVLVNNAGMAYDRPKYLDELDTRLVHDLTAINAITPTLLSKLVLPGMVARRRGAIINIGSALATLPAAPLFSVYAGTKAYLAALSRSLDVEYAQFGVRVHHQVAGNVATKMNTFDGFESRPRLDNPTPEAWAAAAVKQIGHEATFLPYLGHRLQRALIGFLPDCHVNSSVLRDIQTIRRAAEKLN